MKDQPKTTAGDLNNWFLLSGLISANQFSHLQAGIKIHHRFYTGVRNFISVVKREATVTKFN